MSVDNPKYVPQMLSLESLTRIIVGYLKAGADVNFVSYSNVSQLANISSSNIQKNAEFFKYINLLEGERGSYKLTKDGIEYAQALNWGRIKDASEVLKINLKKNELVNLIISYVNINQPVTKNDLESRTAIIAGVSNTPRFKTGIKTLIDMLISTELIKEDNNTFISVEKDYNIITNYSDYIKSDRSNVIELDHNIPIDKVKNHVPINLNINIDPNNYNSENLRALLKLIKEIMDNDG